MPSAVANLQPEYAFEKLIENIKWKYGGPRLLWEMKQSVLENLIREAKLRSVTADWAKSKGTLPTWDGTCGGIRLPHFHLRGEVYPAPENVWRAFTADSSRTPPSASNK